jgi:hypothetical protein
MVAKFQFGNRIVPPNHLGWGKIPPFVTGAPTDPDRRDTGWLRLSGRRKTDRFLKVVVLCCITLYATLVTIFVVAMVHGEFATWLMAG